VPFIVIRGTYHLVGKTKTGAPSGFEPDGDSMQFTPADPSLLGRLQREGSAPRLTTIGSTQLRFEGIDALELHFEGASQPRPLADQARDFLTGKLTMNPVPYKAPDHLRVLPPVQRDAVPGYILSRSLEVHGRPVSFAFAGSPAEPDGSEVVLKPARLRKSLNFASLAAGHAYPLYYDTLFGDLRATLTKAAAGARTKKLGLWTADLSTAGLKVSDGAGLERDGVVFPKLFRRLSEFLKVPGSRLSGFEAWLADKREEVLDLTTNSFTHLDNVIEVKKGKVRLARLPEELVFISAKSASRTVAPWLDV
jgi:endonuclease YncB( thermonuclease family)